MNLYWLLFISVLALTDAKKTSGTKWVRCKTLGSDRCFYTKLTDMKVTIGNIGTNDDVAVEFCSDYKNTDCCKTPPLKGKFSDDWSKGDTELWSSSYFGKCKDKEFLVRRGISVTLSKDGVGRLNVTSITVDGKSPDKKVDEPESFLCGDFQLGGSTLKQTRLCKTGPYTFVRIKKAVVKVGNDGTDDDVSVKICSDSNNVCCEKRLHHLLKDDWKVNKTETWDNSDFDECGDMLYKIQSQPTMTLIKKGDDDLKVDSFELTVETNDIPAIPITYSCEGFVLKGDCKKPNYCQHVFRHCTTSGQTNNGLNTTTTTRRPNQRPTRTTTRPPFRSG